MATVAAPPITGQIVLYGVDWLEYERMLRAFTHRRTVRLTYDRGTLEIITLSPEHESDAEFLGRLVEVLTLERGVPIKSGGRPTMRRRKKQRGLEPDKCYWIASELQVRGKRKIDFRRDPPPDLALEIDVTHSSLDRMAIYAALRVPEVWRYDGKKVLCYHLSSTGRYAVQPTSLAFPGFDPAELLPFLALREQPLDENTVIRQFMAWVRQRFPATGSAPTPP